MPGSEHCACVPSVVVVAALAVGQELFVADILVGVDMDMGDMDKVGTGTVDMEEAAELALVSVAAVQSSFGLVVVHQIFVVEADRQMVTAAVGAVVQPVVGQDEGSSKVAEQEAFLVEL